MNPWHPMDKPVDVKHLGKLLEELGELTAAVSRCLIQGIDEMEPQTGKSNKLWLHEEIADVSANIELVVKHFKLNEIMIGKRMSTKMDRLKVWHGMA